MDVFFRWKAYKLGDCFRLKFPGHALAWFAITASTLVRILFLPPLIHSALDIGELECCQTNRLLELTSAISYSFVLFVMCHWDLWIDKSE